MRKLSDRIL